MAQSLVLSIDVRRGLGISPLQMKIWLIFSQAVLGPTSALEYLFSFLFFIIWNIKKKKVLIASGTEILWRVYLKFKLFFDNIAFPLSPV